MASNKSKIILSLTLAVISLSVAGCSANSQKIPLSSKNEASSSITGSQTQKDSSLTPEKQITYKSGFISTEGSKMIDSNGNQVNISGINWFGFETAQLSPHGLDVGSLGGYLDKIKELGYNTIRLPFSNEMFDEGKTAQNVDIGLNPDLKGLKPIEIMDKLVEESGKRGLKIILDRHRPDSSQQSELWYTNKYSEERWISDWVKLAERYKGNPTVIGADLHNEPHGKATWGSQDAATDWRMAAEKCGNAVLDANPDWLIIVEGIEVYDNQYNWWGGNLIGAGKYPVKLKNPNKLVYSIHEYGPEIYEQPYFKDPSFPANMQSRWQKYWGYLSENNIAPVLIGEFGGIDIMGSGAEGKWYKALSDYIKNQKLNWTFWCLNPDSGDTGGILLDDWYTVNEKKQELVKALQYPFMDR
ncbi:MAG: glycoside hydrolase family 5 protein [Bacillota bacterium]|nr:glycoside hydrolase family 5 protein [Bacillota bacterium]